MRYPYNQEQPEGDNERDKSIVYLDNATIINACSLLADPKKFDPYKLLDLESFCEAFLLYDCVRTLVGHSFSSAFSSGYVRRRKSDLGKHDLRDAVWVQGGEPSRTRGNFYEDEEGRISTSALYARLIDQGLLRPVVLSAGTVHYHIEHMEVLDEVAFTLDVDRTVDQIRKVFGNSIPWRRSSGSSQPTGESPQAFGTIVIGEETWTSDSYPIYYFPKPLIEQKKRTDGDDDFGFEINNNRRTGWMETFASQTFFYVIEAALNSKPYLCSSVRVPIVQDTISQINKQFHSVVHGCLGVAKEVTRRKVETVLQFFGEGAISSLFLPALMFVLREASSRKDVIATVLRLRGHEKIMAFRQWCRRMDAAWKAQDLDQVCVCINQIQMVSEELSELAEVEPLPGSILHVPDVNVLTTRGLDEIKKSESKLLEHCFNPSLAFLKDIGAYLSAAGKNLRFIEDVLEHKISKEDLSVIKELETKREKLYSGGKLPSRSKKIQIQKVDIMPIHQDFRGATITNAVVGACMQNITNSIQQIPAERADLRVALEALQRHIELLAKELPQDASQEAAQNLEDFTREAGKEKPRRSLLEVTSKGLIDAARTVTAISGPIAETINNLKGLLGF